MRTMLLFLFSISVTALTAQPYIVKEGLPNRGNSVEYKGLLYFANYSAGYFTWDLWKSDGTAAGTQLVKSFIPSAHSVYPDFKVCNNQLFFLKNQELWKSNGTTAGTVLLKTFNADFTLWDLIAAGDKVYFRATTEDSRNELWKSNGTVAGTVKVADIPMLISEESLNDIPEFAYANGLLFFWATTAQEGTELWKSNGTAAGTTMVKDINPGTAGSHWEFYDSRITALNNKVYFAADNGATGFDLWTSDGTENGTVLLKNINPGIGSSYPTFMQVVDNTLFLNANDGVHGEELWKTNGTEQRTVLVKDIIPGPVGSYPGLLTAIGGLLYFYGSDYAHGGEPWISDGTEQGTAILADIAPGIDNSSPNEFTDVSGMAFLPWVGFGRPTALRPEHISYRIVPHLLKS